MSATGRADGPEREPRGSRLRLVMAGAAIGAGLAGCAHFLHWTGGVEGLPASEGWAEFPIGRWLLDGGVEVQAMSFCPRSDCPSQGLVALIELKGGERAFGEQLARDPMGLFRRVEAASRQRVARQGGRSEPRGPTEVRPLRIGDWRGAAISLAPRPGKGRPAHAVVLKAPETRSTFLLVSIAEDAAEADAYARQATAR